MPKSTVRYSFEREIIDWASNFSGDRSFCCVFLSDGTVQTTYFASDITGRQPENIQSLVTDNESWFICDTFDLPEYGNIQWQNVQQETMERLIGHQFTSDSFGNETKRVEAFPTSWSMVY